MSKAPSQQNAPSLTPALKALLRLFRRLSSSRQAHRAFYHHRELILRPDGGMSELAYDDRGRLITQLDRPPPGRGMSFSEDFI